MSRQTLDAIFRAADANFNPVPGALCYHYLAGTTTPVTTYSDAAMAVPHAWPVVALSDGTWPQIYLPDSTYKVVIKTAAGVTLYTVDNVEQDSISPPLTWPVVISDSSGHVSSSTGTGLYFRNGNSVLACVPDIGPISTTGLAAGDILRISLPLPAKFLPTYGYYLGSASIGLLGSAPSGMTHLFARIPSGQNYMQLAFSGMAGSTVTEVLVSNIGSSVSNLRSLTITYPAT